jgi:hypothetical protein
MCTTILIPMVSTFFPPHLAKAEFGFSFNLQHDKANNATINSLVPGEAVQGAVVIRSKTYMDGFKSHKLDFTDSLDAQQTWFLTRKASNPSWRMFSQLRHHHHHRLELRHSTSDHPKRK